MSAVFALFYGALNALETLVFLPCDRLENVSAAPVEFAEKLIIFKAQHLYENYQPLQAYYEYIAQHKQKGL